MNAEKSTASQTTTILALTFHEAPDPSSIAHGYLSIMG